MLVVYPQAYCRERGLAAKVAVLLATTPQYETRALALDIEA
jgi:hypothetical protein